MKVKIAVWIIIVLIGLTSLPYIFAVQTSGNEKVFAGFLLNPLDGNSYLAKMQEGQQGSWQFTLPFTAERGSGSYLFLFYLFLGHIASWSGIPSIWIFHITRLLAGIALVFALERFFRNFVPPPAVNLCLGLAVFGTGLGWLALAFNQLTSDFTVPEAFPFLSAYSNPHFPLTLALILYLLVEKRHPGGILKGLIYFLGGLFLALILPFGAVLVILISGLLAVWDWLSTRALDWQAFVLISVGAAPMLAYQYFITQTDSLLKAWNNQNLTPSPPLYDLFLSFSPVLILAIPGAIAVIRGRRENSRLLLVWAGVGLALTYLPFDLQRRFLLGLFIPLVGLGGIGIHQVFANNPQTLRRVSVATLALSLPTSLLILILGIFGAIRHDPLLYFDMAERNGMEWLKQSTPPGAVILASPRMGMYIPGHSGNRVVYGHPFETVNAEQKKAWVLDFYQEKLSADIPSQLRNNLVDYVWLGPRELELGMTPGYLDLPVVYHRDGISIYAVPPLK